MKLDDLLGGVIHIIVIFTSIAYITFLFDESSRRNAMDCNLLRRRSYLDRNLPTLQ